jgi:bacterioferritin (cytochrome b1)
MTNQDNSDVRLPPQQDRESNDGGTNTKKILQDLKRDQEEFYSRISQIAQSDIAAGPQYKERFEGILQNSSKRIADLDKELKKLEEA